MSVLVPANHYSRDPGDLQELSGPGPQTKLEISDNSELCSH